MTTEELREAAADARSRAKDAALLVHDLRAKLGKAMAAEHEAQRVAREAEREEETRRP